jgi:hypothetical protein
MPTLTPAQESRLADLLVGQTYDRERSRLPFDMTAGRRQSALRRLELSLAHDLGDREASLALEVLMPGPIAEALERLAGRMIRRAGTSDAVLIALDCTCDELNARRPALLSRALNGTVAITPAGGSRNTGRREDAYRR